MSLLLRSKAAQEYAAKLLRAGASYAHIAVRLECTVEDVERFADALKNAAVGQDEAEHLLPPLHSAFLDACKAYNSMGEHLKACSEIVSNAMQVDELADFIDSNWSASSGTTIGERVAQLLYGTQHLVIKPINTNGTAQPVQPAQTPESSFSQPGPDADPGD